MSEYQDPAQRRSSMVIWLFVSVIVIVAVAAWAFTNRSFSDDVTQAAEAVQEAVAPLVESLVSDLAPAEPEAPVEPEKAPPPVPRRRAAAVVATAPPPASVELPARPTSIVRNEETMALPTANVPALRPSSSVPNLAGMIFTANDADVFPPSLVMPLSNAPLPRETLSSAERLSIEILVKADGTVASARVTSEPVSVAETLQVVNALSIAKSWTFGPATKDGRPVQYRMLVALDKVLMWRSRIKSELP